MTDKAVDVRFRLAFEHAPAGMAVVTDRKSVV